MDYCSFYETKWQEYKQYFVQLANSAAECLNLVKRNYQQVTHVNPTKTMTINVTKKADTIVEKFIVRPFKSTDIKLLLLKENDQLSIIPSWSMPLLCDETLSSELYSRNKGYKIGTNTNGSKLWTEEWVSIVEAKNFEKSAFCLVKLCTLNRKTNSFESELKIIKSGSTILRLKLVETLEYQQYSYKLNFHGNTIYYFSRLEYQVTCPISITNTNTEEEFQMNFKKKEGKKYISRDNIVEDEFFIIEKFDFQENSYGTKKKICTRTHSTETLIENWYRNTSNDFCMMQSICREESNRKRNSYFKTINFGDSSNLEYEIEKFEEKIEGNDYNEKFEEKYLKFKNSENFKGNKSYTNSVGKQYRENWSIINGEHKFHKFEDNGFGLKTTLFHGHLDQNSERLYEFHDKYEENVSLNLKTTVKQGFSKICGNKWHSLKKEGQNWLLCENFGKNKESEWFDKWYEDVNENFCYKRGKNATSEWEEEWKEIFKNKKQVLIFNTCWKKNKEISGKSWSEAWSTKYLDNGLIEKNCFKKRNEQNGDYYENSWGDKAADSSDNTWIHYDKQVSPLKFKDNYYFYHQ